MNLLKLDLQFRRGFKDPKRMTAIHAIPCSACIRSKDWIQTTPTQAHHKHGMGAGKKVSDLLSMSLCFEHHQGGKKGISFHDTPLMQWQERWGTQDELIELTNKMLND